MFKFFKQNVGWVLMGIVSRVIPHPANFTAIGGMSVYLGRKKQSLWIPILSMLVSDMFLGFDSLFMRVVIYSSFGLMYLCGRYVKNLWLASVLGSAIFFVTTNTGAWLTSGLYLKNGFGLVQSLYMGLPFWRNALLADILFAQAFGFGAILLERWLPKHLFSAG